MQQGGQPSPWDRINAARLMGHCLQFIEEWVQCRPIIHRSPKIKSGIFGFKHGKIVFTPLDEVPALIHDSYRRPKDQWWEALIPINASLV